MDWIKRNLYFVIGGVVALILMGLSGYYFYSKWQLNNEIWEKLNADYEELRRLNSQNPHPGSGNVHNIDTAKDQTKELQAILKKAEASFQRIAPIPDGAAIGDQEFAAALSRTIDQLSHEATGVSVMLPTPRYSFSFEAERPRVSFAAGSLQPLAQQLGEVKAICQVLFDAKINSLDNLRRERVSADDNNGPVTDYLNTKTTTNELAVISPYEITFHSFGQELAAVLTGFANSPNGLLVKTINISHDALATNVDASLTAAAMAPAPVYTTPVVPPPVQTRADEAAAFARRYGLNPGALRPNPVPPPVQPVITVPSAVPGTRPGALPVALDETPLKITMAVHVVKIIAPKAAANAPARPPR